MTKGISPCRGLSCPVAIIFQSEITILSSPAALSSVTVAESKKAAPMGLPVLFFTVRLASTTVHRRFLHSQLNPGSPAAHRRVCLVLLRSRPDTVHRDLLRRTQTSTPLMKRCSTNKKPQLGITPAIADCRYRAPLSPRLHGIVTIQSPPLFVKSQFV